MKHLLNISIQGRGCENHLMGTSWAVDYSFNPKQSPGFDKS
jgi:hypothetical protein